MAGKWKIDTDETGTQVVYFDHTTHKAWIAGKSPPGVPAIEAVRWVIDNVSRADLVEINEQQFACDFGQHIFNPRLH